LIMKEIPESIDEFADLGVKGFPNLDIGTFSSIIDNQREAGEKFTYLVAERIVEANISDACGSVIICYPKAAPFLADAAIRRFDKVSCDTIFTIVFHDPSQISRFI
jgi:hypothetical protein